MSQQGWVWRTPPGWPEPPPGWVPPPGWQPHPDWPPPPAGWMFWAWGGELPDPGPPPLARVEGPERRGLVFETWFVQLAFLVPGITGALSVLAAQLSGANVTRFPTIANGHPVVNLVFGILSYLSVAALVPLALLLLSRTGQPPAALGLGRPRFTLDWLPGAGLALAGFGCNFALAIVLLPLLAGHKSWLVQVSTGDVPKYYVVYGIALSAITAVTEETLVSGYLLTRLEQLGWTPRRALVLSLTLRTSYHIYYGLGFLLTIPIGYLLTRSFQKHRRLNRPIIGHFLFDAVQLVITVLAG